MWIALFAFAAAATDPTDTAFAGATKPADPIEKPVTTLSAGFGGAFASGNTVSHNFTGTLAGLHKYKSNQEKLDFAANFGQGIVDTNGDGHLDATERKAGLADTAKKITGEGRYDRFFGKVNSLYVLAGVLTDPFAGYDYNVHGQLGFSHDFSTSDKGHLMTELGFDVAHEAYVAGVDPASDNVFAAHLLVGADRTVSGSVTLADKFELYENVVDLHDLRLVNTATLTSKIGKIVSVQVGDTLLFDNVPVEGFEKTDNTTTISFVATLL